MKNTHKVKKSSSEATKLKRKKAAAERKKLMAVLAQINGTDDSCEPIGVQEANRELLQVWAKIYERHNTR